MKVFLTAFILALSVTAKCQLDKKTWMVGGNGSFYSNNQTFSFSSNVFYYKNTNIEISPSIGYFIIDRLALGLRGNLIWEKSEYIRGTGSASGGGNGNPLRYAVGPFARYYFLNKEKAFNILSEINYQLGVNSYLAPPRSSGKYNKFSAMAGAEMFFNSTVGLDILVGYKATTQTIKDLPGAFNDTRKGFQLSIGFQIHLQKN